MRRRENREYRESQASQEVLAYSSPGRKFLLARSPVSVNQLRLHQGQRFLNRFDAENEQISVSEIGQRRFDGGQFAACLDDFGMALSGVDAAAQQPIEFAIGTIRVEEDTIEAVANDLAHRQHIVVAAIAGGEDQRAAAVRKAGKGFDQRRQRRGIVRVIDKDDGLADAEDVEAAGNLLGIAGERTSPSRRASSGSPSDQTAAQAARAFSTWKATWPPCVIGTSLQRDQHLFAFALGKHHLTGADKDSPFAARAMRAKTG